MELLKLLESVRSPVLDTLFELITNIGGEAVTLVVVCLLYWCVNRELAYRAGLAFFVSGALVQILKLLFRIERPWILDADFAAVESALASATGYSFPSGHTQSATALYLTLAISTKKKSLKAIFIALMLAIGFSRMYLGVHTPLDVGVALAVAVMTVALTWAVMRGHERAELSKGGAKRFDLAIAAAIALISAASLLICVILQSNGTVDYLNAADCAKTAGSGIGFAAGWYFERGRVQFQTRTDRLWKQAVKLVVGIAVVLALKEGLKALFALSGGSLILDAMRYMAMVLFAIGLYPLIIKKIFNKGQIS